MALNWLEELVSQYYRIRGYMVSENIPMKMDKSETRTVQGHSDIDVLAINNDEIIHIECQTWWGPSYAEEPKHFDRLKSRFGKSKSFIFEKYQFLDEEKQKVKKIFVSGGKAKQYPTGNGPWDRLEQFCKQNNIELVEINTIVSHLLKEINLKYPPGGKIGKEEGLLRLMIHLLHNGFINNNMMKNNSA
jgi:hypothetical protein